jgi:HlyD family secretion protein
MRIVLSLLILAAVGAGGWYAFEQFKPQAQPRRYLTAKIERGSVVAKVRATGTLEPLVKVLVGSRVSGNCIAWYKDFNAPVKQGDLLAELDQDRIKATIAQRRSDVAVAKARVEEAQAALAEARLQYKRLESAYQRNASSAFELESARIAVQRNEASLHAAEAQAEAAEAALETAQIDLEWTKITASIDGVVISRDIDVGQTVAASLQAPTLFTIAKDLTKMRVNAAVSETDVGQVREGMEAEFRVDAYPERRFRGVVSQVRFQETVTDNVVTYQTLIDVDNPDLLLRPGMTAEINFETQRADDVLIVPNSALRFDPKSSGAAELNWMPGRGRKLQPRVFLLVNGELQETPVELGISDGSVTAVRSDKLKPGDEVVVDFDYSRGVPTAGGGGPMGGGRRRGPF